MWRFRCSCRRSFLNSYYLIKRRKTAVNFARIKMVWTVWILRLKIGICRIVVFSYPPRWSFQIIDVVWTRMRIPEKHSENIETMSTRNSGDQSEMKRVSSSLHLSNGNRTEWSPIRSVIIRVITKSDDRAAGESDLFITSMITDWIGQHEVLLPINHKNYSFRGKKLMWE